MQLYKRFETTSTIKYFVSTTYASFSTNEDVERARKFFEGKDVSKYNMALAQAYDSITAKIRWIEVSLRAIYCSLLRSLIHTAICSAPRTTFRVTSMYGRNRLGRGCRIEVHCRDMSLKQLCMRHESIQGTVLPIAALSR